MGRKDCNLLHSLLDTQLTFCYFFFVGLLAGEIGSKYPFMIFINSAAFLVLLDVLLS
jgi:hypothetical protein